MKRREGGGRGMDRDEYTWGKLRLPWELGIMKLQNAPALKTQKGKFSTISNGIPGKRTDKSKMMIDALKARKLC